MNRDAFFPNFTATSQSCNCEFSLVSKMVATGERPVK